VLSGEDGSAKRDQAAPDRGEPDPLLREVLRARAAGTTRPDFAAVVSSARLLVPVVASPDDPGEMVWVLTTGRDGRLGLLAFSGIDSLHRFEPDARPMPMTGAEAAQAALAAGGDALVVDIAGPAMAVVEGEEVAGLAQRATGPV
jgi:hypothetical protein